jgi:hypothetical protein
MNVVSFLIFWSLPLLQAGGHSQSLPRAVALCADAYVTPLVVQHARDGSSPGDAGVGSPGDSLEDEEDSLEDLFFDTGFLLSPLWRDLGRDDRSALARSRHDLLRSPSRIHPLRC